MKKMIILLCLPIIFASRSVYGKTFYVDNQLSSNCTTGNYSISNRTCTGSDGNAFKTVAGGAAVLSSGDTMYIRSGTYDEYNIYIGANYASMATVSGYQNEWPVLRNNAVITDHAVEYFDLRTTTNNLTFTKLEFTSTNGRADVNGHEPWAMNGWFDDDRGLIVVDNCYFHDMPCFIGGNGKFWIKNNRFITFGSTPYNSSSAIYLCGGGTGTSRTGWNDASIIEYNYFENSLYNGTTLVGTSIDIHKGDTGDHCKYFIVRYNIFNSAMVWATSHVGLYSKIYNNTAYNVYYFFGSRHAENVEIENNLHIDATSPYGLCLCDDGSGPVACINVTIKNNLTSGVAAPYWNTCQDCTLSGNLMNTNPVLLNPTPTTWTDFRLQSISPAINAGLNLGIDHQNGIDPNNTTWPPSTLNQNSYGVGWEIGAFVYRGSDVTPPSPPKGLGIIKN
jgi:hypothetical protein